MFSLNTDWVRLTKKKKNKINNIWYETKSDPLPISCLSKNQLTKKISLFFFSLYNPAPFTESQCQKHFILLSKFCTFLCFQMCIWPLFKCPFDSFQMYILSILFRYPAFRLTFGSLATYYKSIFSFLLSVPLSFFLPKFYEVSSSQMTTRQSVKRVDQI